MLHDKEVIKGLIVGKDKDNALPLKASNAKQII